MSEQRNGKKSGGDGDSGCGGDGVKGRDGCWGDGKKKTLERDFPRLLLLSWWYGARVVADSSQILVPGTSDLM